MLVPAAQATLKRALFYGPTTDTNTGVAEKFVGCCNIADGGHGFAAIGTTSANSQVWSEAIWLTKTTTDFAAFDIIIIGDAPRGTFDRTRWNTAIVTRAVWSAAVTGNVLIFGGDPDWHFFFFGQPGAQSLVQNAVTFGANQTGYSQHATGLYVALSQVNFGSNPGGQDTAEPVALLGGLGTAAFTAFTPQKVDETPLGNVIEKIASDSAAGFTPMLDCLSDSDLSGWTQSAHQTFWSWPATFVPWAIVLDMPAGSGTPNYMTPCAFSAIPGMDPAVYVLIRPPPGLLNQLTASPCLQAHLTGQTPAQQCSVTARLATLPGNTPVANRRIGFAVTSGPNVSATLTYSPTSKLTDNNGQVTLTYPGSTTVGQDVITVFLDDNGNGSRDPCEAVTTALCNWGSPYVTVAANPTTAYEAGPVSATFTITRVGGTTGPLTVNLALGGTAATVGEDYLLATPPSINYSGTPFQATI